MVRPSFDPGFSTEELTETYSAASTVGAILEFEAALALALSDAGIASTDEAEEVAAACRAGVDDPESILASTWETGTPMISLREEIGTGKWFHHGATTQDAIDTGQMIQAHRALAHLETSLSASGRKLADLVTEHREQPHIGRTFLQDARPMTFGFRLATWLDAVIDHIEDLRDRRGKLAVQLGGPVGTMEAYGEEAPRVISRLAKRLGLAVPTISWHTNRTQVVALAQSVERTATTMAKIGTDVAILASGREVAVRYGKSSSMPGKANPLDSIRAVAADAACKGAVAMLTSSPSHELDRGVGGWHVEWIALPLVFQTAGAACEAIRTCLDSLEVNAEAMDASAGTEVGLFDPGQVDVVLARAAGRLG